VEERQCLAPRVGAAAAAVTTDNGLYTRRVGSDRRKLPRQQPIKVCSRRTRDAISISSRVCTDTDSRSIERSSPGCVKWTVCTPQVAEKRSIFIQQTLCIIPPKVIKGHITSIPVYRRVPACMAGVKAGCAHLCRVAGNTL